MILEAGKDRILTEVSADMQNGQWGSGTALWTVNDPGLLSAIAATNLLLDANLVTGEIIVTSHTSGTATGVGESFAEYGVKNASGTFYNRGTFAPITKGAEEIITIYTFNIGLVE